MFKRDLLHGVPPRSPLCSAMQLLSRFCKLAGFGTNKTLDKVLFNLTFYPSTLSTVGEMGSSCLLKIKNSSLPPDFLTSGS